MQPKREWWPTPSKIARSIEPFYGKPAAEKLFSLLAGHYEGIRNIWTRPWQGRRASRTRRSRRLTANAAEISSFLSGANPNLPKDTVMGLLMAHAAHHLTQFQQLKEAICAGSRDLEGDEAASYLVADALRRRWQPSSRLSSELYRRAAVMPPPLHAQGTQWLILRQRHGRGFSGIRSCACA